MQALLNISMALTSRLNVQDVLAQVVEACRELLDCDHSSLLLWSLTKKRFETGASTDIGWEISQRVQQHVGAWQWIMEHRKPVVVSNVVENPHGSHPIIEETGVKAYAGVPVLYEEETLGILYAVSFAPHAFGDEDVKIMTTLANMAAVAIRNARSAPASRRTASARCARR